MEVPVKEKAWLELYREAILEHDSEVLKKRLALANQAIQKRTLDLWHRGATEVGERERLTAAARYLQILRSLTDKKGRAA